MKWERGHQSPNVIDRRGRSGFGGRGALGPLILIGSRFGITGVLVAVGLYFAAQYLTGGGEQALSGDPQAQGARRASDENAQFAAFVLDDAQATWQELFAERGLKYEPAKLVLFTEQTETACGFGLAAIGPFYCPRDGRVFVDLAFFDELERRFGAPGDFARAYVVAHEIGHHVQHQLGLDAARQRAGSRAEGPTGASVRLELQADCFAGIWAHSTKQREILETGDLEEGLRAAAAVGDDRLQRQRGGGAHPETWTHGSAQQRSRWFRRGFERGRLEACDTSSGEL